MSTKGVRIRLGRTPRRGDQHQRVVRGSFCSGYLGYYALAPYQGRGYVREGLKAVIRMAFGEYALHRLEANIQPDNVRSIGPVRAVGFRREGYSPTYPKVGGRWRDHERWALTVEDWRRHRGSNQTAGQRS